MGRHGSSPRRNAAFKGGQPCRRRIRMPTSSPNVLLWREGPIRTDPALCHLTLAARISPSSSRGEVEIWRSSGSQRAEREVVQRYDLAGERASVVQRSLGLSPRQFFRDRRQALAHARGPSVFERAPGSLERADAKGHAPTLVFGGDVEMAARSFARAVAQAGKTQCLEVLRRVARNAVDPVRRLDLLLEWRRPHSSIATKRRRAAQSRRCRVSRARPSSARPPAIGFSDVSPPLKRTSQPRRMKASRTLRARWLCSVVVSAANPAAWEPWAALADALGDRALLQFWIGGFSAARVCFTGSRGLSPSFGSAKAPQLWKPWQCTRRLRRSSPVAHARLSRTFQRCWATPLRQDGRRRRAFSAPSLSVSTVGGDYAEAIRWYRSLAPLTMSAARPSDRSALTQRPRIHIRCSASRRPRCRSSATFGPAKATHARRCPLGMPMPQRRWNGAAKTPRRCANHAKPSPDTPCKAASAASAARTA